MKGVRVHLVSDVHGHAEALARAADGADVFVCLGDLLAFIDYVDPRRGLFPGMFGAENAVRYIELRTEKRFDEARELSQALFAALGDGAREAFNEAVRDSYAELFGALPTPAYLTYGNVDLPRLWPEYLRDGHHVLDGETIKLGGVQFGFVGGGLPSPYHTPYEVDEDVHAERVAAIGEVDILCSHIPPAVPDLLYDVVARRHERGSEALLAHIEKTQPRYALFGHVHQPLAARWRIGRTECLNVGHFRATGRPFVLDV